MIIQKAFGPSSDFDEENASDSEKANEWWGDPDVDPNTGRDKDDDDDNQTCRKKR